MRAAITQRETIDSYGTSTDALESAYITYFERYGIQLYPIPNFTKEPTSYMQNIDMLILTGGGDIPLIYYVDKQVSNEQKHRDVTEKILVEYCFAHNIPVLAICRGMQFINGMLGGKVRCLQGVRKNREDHPVMLQNLKKTIYVNNYHNDGILIEDISPILTIEAIDKEHGIIEAYSWADKKLLGIQWHPERDYEFAKHRYDTDNIIEKFIYYLKGDNL